MGEPLFEYFKSLKERSKKPSILAIVGAGLSAPSGLPASHHPNTEADIIWRNYTAIDLATPDAFDANPALVWMYYAYRRHMALNASPNRAHYLLKELSECEGLEFLTISQNMDGLSRRAGHFKRLTSKLGEIHFPRLQSSANYLHVRYVGIYYDLESYGLVNHSHYMLLIKLMSL
ncbi:NAD-dependent protein deacylase [Pichia kudriavzevii]|uniref:NAD-dependent protein deacylase n=1 Tax=Pichia kudriavzevii TaxID=4909 RepID=A0A1V2LI96_PICKU|nr:NAD-dependent protein deacylase [Pichia kudriavzevii]